MRDANEDANEDARVTHKIVEYTGATHASMLPLCVISFCTHFLWAIAFCHMVWARKRNAVLSHGSTTSDPKRHTRLREKLRLKAKRKAQESLSAR